MNRQRKCRQCRDLFLPDPRSYRPTKNRSIRVSPQRFCSKPECRRESRRRSHRACVQKKPDYREKCRLAARRWRKKHGGYWQKYRDEHPEAVKRNRNLQRRRDAQAKGDLANNNTIQALHSEKLSRIDILIDLANINSIPVSWTVVSEQIVAFLRWSSRLANIKAIGNRKTSSAQSPA